MEDLFGCVIVILVGCVMLSIGIVQYRKKIRWDFIPAKSHHARMN